MGKEWAWGGGELLPALASCLRRNDGGGAGMTGGERWKWRMRTPLV